MYPGVRGCGGYPKFTANFQAPDGTWYQSVRGFPRRKCNDVRAESSRDDEHETKSFGAWQLLPYVPPR